MAAQLLIPPFRATDANGNPISGAKWKFYATGTLTPATVYSDEELSTSLGSVVTADAGGKFVAIYGDAAISYRAILTTSADIAVGYDFDPINTDALTILASSSGAASVGFLQSGTSAVARTVQDKLRDSLSVFDFFTAAQIADVKAGTLALDVTAPFQAAINASIAASKGLFVPAGNYSVTTLNITLTSSAASSDFTMFGDTRTGSILTKRDSSTTPILNLSHTTEPTTANVDIMDLRLEGNAKGHDGLRNTAAASTTLTRLFILDCDNGIDSRGMIGSEIEYCYIAGCNNGIKFRANGALTAYSNANSVRYCRIADNTVYGIDYGQGSQLRIVECDIESNGRTSVVTVTSATPGVVTWTAHGLTAGTEIMFTNSGGALPTGLTAGTVYFVLATGLTANTFQVSLTNGGAAINTSSTGTGTHTAHVYRAGGVVVRSTVDDEIGTSILAIDKTWFEANKGPTIQFETVTSTGLFVQISNSNIISSAAGKAILAAGGGNFVLTNVSAPSAGDTFDMTCNNLTLLGCYLNILAGTATYTLAMSTIIGGSPVEGTFQRGIQIGAGNLITQTWAAGAAGYNMGPNTSNGRYYFQKQGTATGVYEFDGDIFRTGVKVLSTRKTGWGLATGTATRTTFATGSVTLPQLAERVKALIDDLEATAGHGLLGS
jgi:hypothetical protein